MKKYLKILFCLLILICITACTKTAEEMPTEIIPEDKETASAVIYFSATGNTREAAQKIADVTASDIYEIIPAELYSEVDLDYTDDNSRANKEMNDEHSRPQIANDLSISVQYGVIYLGYPIWWGKAPRIIQTFIESYNLESADIYLFCTSGSSSIDNSVSDLNRLYPNLNIIDGRRMNGAEEDTIKKWLNIE